MANNVAFLMYSGPPLTISEDNPFITKELTESIVKSITVEGDPWAFFDSPYYGGNFTVCRAGELKLFPPILKTIKSVRRIKGGINSSQVTLYPYPFFEGKGQSFQSKAPQIPDTYFSLKVDNGAVIFFNDENYTGDKRILLKGDEVQNFTAVKLSSIGKSVKTAGEMWPQ